MAITFPRTRLITGAYIALSADLSAAPGTWSWTSIASYVRYQPGVQLRMHRQNEGATTSTCTATLTLDNQDGRFTRRNADSPYFGKLTMNTPIYLTVDVGDGEEIRYEGYVNEWPTAWTDESGTDSTVTIQCSGVLRRPTINKKNLLSAPRYYIPTTSPVAYWSLEDGQLVRTGRADVGPTEMMPLTGVHPSGAVITFPQFGSAQLAPWLPSVVSRSGSGGLTILYSTVSMPGFSAAWTVDLYYNSTSDAPTSTVDINPSYLSGSSGWPQLIFNVVGGEIQSSLNAEPEVSASVPNLYDGRLHHIRWTAAQNGAKITSSVYVDGVRVISSPTAGNATLAPIAQIGLTTESGGGTIALGHVAVWTTPPTLATAVLVSQGYAGEMAHVRMARIAAQINIPFTTSATYSQALGPQTVDPPVTVLRDAEAVDGGILYESGFGLAYLSLDERYNASAAMELDFGLAHIAGVPRPTDDDQRVRNQWTVSRRNGGEATYEMTDGPVGTGASGPGLYDDETVLNAVADSDLYNQASWRVRLGTIDEDRWPAIPIRLHRTPGLIPDWVTVGPGSRVPMSHPPTQMPEDTVETIVEGWTERWDSTTWEATLNSSPWRPYRIGVLAADSGDTGEFVGHYEWDSCVVHSTTVLTTATSFTVDTVPLLSTVSDDYPVFTRISGERIRINSVSGSSNPQTVNVTRSINGVVKSHAANDVVELHPDSAFYLGL